ncbi:NAD(P)H-binding protein [Streptomyces sp. ISL-12]|uniref:NAD(P)-dependent oxidoreductase n=1 Tax=Streptomyces sp. ISL-12 TaxID=2819177 RepID=UPI001BE5FBB7|nr:NAD(P)H-binding protein [Streptomyces sp. ISL-12]MBT2409582.1 NAD(P)H-binding protein [Streptomyces sp. ISL-12]
MRLTVVGATGGVGREIVRQALDAGHRVTAVVRDPARLPVTGERLEVFRAELSDAGRLRPAVAGRDAVLSGLGARTWKEAGVTSRLTRTVLAAMAAEEVRRLVVVSASPLGPAADADGLVDRALRALLWKGLGDVYGDLRRMESDLAAGTADWTVVRPPRLLDEPGTGRYRKVVGGNPAKGRSLARADVAHAMLASVADPATVRQAVGIAC